MIIVIIMITVIIVMIIYRGYLKNLTVPLSVFPLGFFLILLVDSKLFF